MMEDKFKKLEKLLEDQNYPSVYFYKFIIKNDRKKMVQIKQCFNEIVEFSTRPSKNGKYLSVSIKEMMLDSKEIIRRYKQVGKIEGVITL